VIGQVESLISYRDLEQGERYAVQAMRYIFTPDSAAVQLKIRGHWYDAAAFIPAMPQPDTPISAPGDFRHLLGNRE
jgi:hypothetical protein